MAERKTDERAIEFLYTNWRGDTARRRVVPMRLEYGFTEHHRSSQWLLHAIDLEKNAERTFALSGIIAAYEAQMARLTIERDDAVNDWLLAESEHGLLAESEEDER